MSEFDDEFLQTVKLEHDEDEGVEVKYEPFDSELESDNVVKNGIHESEIFQCDWNCVSCRNHITELTVHLNADICSSSNDGHGASVQTEPPEYIVDDTSLIKKEPEDDLVMSEPLKDDNIDPETPGTHDSRNSRQKQYKVYEFDTRQCTLSCVICEEHLRDLRNHLELNHPQLQCQPRCDSDLIDLTSNSNNDPLTEPSTVRVRLKTINCTNTIPFPYLRQIGNFEGGKKVLTVVLTPEMEKQNKKRNTRNSKRAGYPEEAVAKQPLCKTCEPLAKTSHTNVIQRGHNKNTTIHTGQTRSTTSADGENSESKSEGRSSNEIQQKLDNSESVISNSMIICGGNVVCSAPREEKLTEHALSHTGGETKGMNETHTGESGELTQITHFGEKPIEVTHTVENRATMRYPGRKPNNTSNTVVNSSEVTGMRQKLRLHGGEESAQITHTAENSSVVIESTDMTHTGEELSEQLAEHVSHTGGNSGERKRKGKHTSDSRTEHRRGRIDETVVALPKMTRSTRRLTIITQAGGESPNISHTGDHLSELTTNGGKEKNVRSRTPVSSGISQNSDHAEGKLVKTVHTGVKPDKKTHIPVILPVGNIIGRKMTTRAHPVGDLASLALVGGKPGDIARTGEKLDNRTSTVVKSAVFTVSRRKQSTQVHTGEDSINMNRAGEKSGNLSRTASKFDKMSYIGDKIEKLTRIRKKPAKTVRNDDVGRRKKAHTDEKKFKCGLCAKIFKVKSNLRVHMRTHTGEKPYQCGQCNKRFVTTSILKNHETTHTGVKRHKCIVCLKKFARLDVLMKHTKDFHTGRKKKFKCNKCEKTFTRQELLDLHNRRHTKEKLYNCDECDKSFLERRQLTFHMSTHTGVKPFKCDVCTEDFAWSHALIKHKKVHVRRKILRKTQPHWCDTCDRSYKTQRTLSDHQQIHTRSV